MDKGLYQANPSPPYGNLDVFKLIRMVKVRRPLWDRKHTHYHDRNLTMGMWAEVATTLGSDTDSIRAKWKGLRDTFRGELKKVRKSIAKGVPCKSTQWEYFEDMEFVKDQIYSNKRNMAETLQTPLLTSLIKDTTNESVDITVFCKAEVSEEGEEEDEPKHKYIKMETTSNGSSESNPKRPSTRTSSPVLADNQEQVPEQNPPATTYDDDYSFLMSILPQLRSLPTTRNLYIRLKIQELLYHEIVALQAT